MGSAWSAKQRGARPKASPGHSLEPATLNPLYAVPPRAVPEKAPLPRVTRVTRVGAGRRGGAVRRVAPACVRPQQRVEREYEKRTGHCKSRKRRLCDERQTPPRTPSAQSPPRTSTRAVAQAASARRAAAASGVPAGAASSSPAPTSAHRHSHTPQGEGGQYLLRYYLGESQRGPRKTSFNAKSGSLKFTPLYQPRSTS